jgi:hypothetical protein
MIYKKIDIVTIAVVAALAALAMVSAVCFSPSLANCYGMSMCSVRSYSSIGNPPAADVKTRGSVNSMYTWSGLSELSDIESAMFL